MRPICSICWLVFVIGLTSGQKCNYPATADRIPNRNDPFSYLECGAPGYYMVRQCPDGTSFDSTSMKCGQMPHWIIKGPQKPPQGGYNPQPFPPQGGYNPKPYPTSGGSNPFFPPPKSFNNNNNQIETYLPRNNNNNQWNGNNQWNNNNNNNNRNNLPDYNNYGGNRGNDYNNYGGPNNNNNNNHNNNNNNGQYPNQPNLQVLTPSTFKPPPPRPFQPQIKAFEPRQNPPPFQPSPFINNQLPPPPTGNGNFAERVEWWYGQLVVNQFKQNDSGEVSGPNMVLPPDPGSEYPIELYSSCRIGEMCPHNINRLQYCAYSGSKFLQCSGQGWILQECPGGAVFRNGRCTNGFEEIFQPGAPPLLPTNNNNIRPPPPPPRPPQTVTQNSIYNPNTPIQLVRLPGPPPFTQNPIQNSFNPNPNHNNNRPNPNPFDADNFFARKGRNPTRSYVIDNNQPIFSNRVMHIKHNRPWYRPAKTQRDQGQQDSPKTVAELDGRFMEQQNRLNIAPIVLHKNWQLIPASSPIHQASAALTKE